MTDYEADRRAGGQAGGHDQLPGHILEAARAVNVPPPTPREEIWLKVQAARRKSGPVDVIPLSARPPARPAARRWAAWITGIAAVLILGIGLGRMMGPAADPSSSSTTLTRVPGDSAASGSLAYTVATIQHLGRVETLLTSLRASGQLDPSFAIQARELLGSTRLLRSSSELDPRLRRLLSDLEDILMQIAQYNSARSDQELDLITDGLEERQVIPRLRAVPAGPAQAL
ncbi:MAG TPA: hypothetical protein VFO95_17730 [Gemmatimonadales bacterium]|nr:hypothetical protein [Gemmatimonadales bacterium]